MMATPRKYSPQEVDSVVDRLMDGVSCADVAYNTGIPVATIRTWQAKYESPAGADKLRKHREAFVAVIDSFNQIRTVLGQIQAMDYANALEGSGAQYGNTDRSLQVIDFMVDVTKAVEGTLTPEQLAFFNENLKDNDLEEALKVQTVQFMRLQEKLGKVFIARELFPVSKYFVSAKQ
jgi:hypothetical protein